MFRPLVYAAVVAATLPLCASARAEPGTCMAAPELARFEQPLRNAALAIRTKGEVTIVAMGSSSTSGVGASDPSHSYPAMLAEDLQRRWPGARVTVINAGVGGEEVNQMVDRFGRDIMPQHPDMVIWQLGTNLMLKSGTMESFTDSLRDGLEKLRPVSADVVLMDPQFVPRVLVEPLHDRVVRAIAAIGKETRTDVFPRFAIMRSWIESGQFAMEDFSSPDQLHMNDVGYGCLAQLLADAIESGVKAASPATTETARIR